MSTNEKEYWTNRYQEGRTGWDIGYAAPALIDFTSKKAKDTKILIPGAGNAHEAEALWNLGYQNLFVCDISPIPIAKLKERSPQIPAQQLLCMDFFDIKDSFDLILEQTFFCSMLPKFRPNYVAQMAKLLPKGGTLAGLLFQHALDQKGNRPFGGSAEEYREHFERQFEIVQMKTAKNSIAPRSGNELFIEFVRK